MRLTLIVENTAALEGGSSATKVFDHDGGTIGSGESATWRLIDRQRSVSPEHVEVLFRDGSFCAQPTSSAGLTVNGSNRPLPANKVFRINDGDLWQVGKFEVHVHVSLDVGDDDNAAKQDWENRFASMDSIVPGSLHVERKKAGVVLGAGRGVGGGGSGGGAGSAIDLLGDLTDEERRAPTDHSLLASQRASEADPVTLFEKHDAATGATTLDPLALLSGSSNRNDQAMEDQKLSEALGLSDSDVPKAAPIAEPNVEKSAFIPPRVSRADGNRHQADDLDAYLADIETGQAGKSTGNSASANTTPTGMSFTPSASGRAPEPSSDYQPPRFDRAAVDPNATGLDIDHKVLRPLTSGLGVTPEDVSGPGADQFAKEVGQALRTAIEGLIHVRNESWTARVGRQRTHLQPIEDNPIKLGQSADEVLNDLFVNQNPVHLSAKASGEESLQEVIQHQAAAQVAVEAALAAVLESLSPAQLTKRFERYKGRNRLGQASSSEGWNWQMYQAYYQELNASRQNGLSEMFWEVFFQNYDRETRRTYNGGNGQ